MRRYLLLLISFFSALTGYSAEDTWDNEEFCDPVNDLQFEFDDFPNNSSPDIESLFSEYDNTECKEFNDFIEKPDTANTVEKQSELGIDFHGFPSSIVNGCVNVMSGEYQENATDFTLPGAMPLNMQRHYSGGRCEKRSFLYGWQLSHGAKLLCYKSKHRHDCAVLKGSDRHGVLYRGLYHENRLICPDSFFKKGVTNCALGEIGAKTNFKNDRLYKDHKKIELYTADKTHYLFSRSTHDPERESQTHAYHLDKLELPDGNSFQYKYSQTFGMPTSISLFNRNGVRTGGLKLKNIPDPSKFQTHPELTYLTSTGEEINYRFKVYGKHSKNRAVLSEVEPPHAPKIKYSYETIDGHARQKRLIKRELPDNRMMEIVYGDDEKVLKLLSPSGKGGKSVATHTFSYVKKGDKRSTRVRNALGGTKHYYWNDKTKRLNGIVTRNSEGHRLSMEKYRWGNDKKDASHLTARIWEEGDGSLIGYQEYRYDAYGNISSSALYGNLTGDCKRVPSIGKALRPPRKGKCEVYKTYWKYDDLKRRVFEDDNRVSNRFVYFKNTDLLSAQYTSYEGRTQIRHFYSYDASGAVCEDIIDNGSKDSIDDLTEVTERLIKKTQNAVTGLPKIIEEFALDITSGQEVLIRKTVNEYDRHGWLITQAIYDNQGDLAYTLEWQYDAHGNVIWEKNALGHVSTSQYDKNDNLVFEQKPDSAARILTYDFMNRLIHEEQKASASESLHKTYCYDAMGNCLSTTDIYGKETCSTYDCQGHLIQTIYPVVDDLQPKSTVTYKHDSMGRVNAITDANGNTTFITYNLRGKPTKTVYPDGTSENHTYTVWGELSKSTTRDGTSITYTYDPQGREIEKKWFDTSGNLLKSTTKSYDAFHLISETDASGIETHYAYDPTGKLLTETIMKKQILYGYDSLGQRTTTTQRLENDISVTLVEINDALGQVVESYSLSSNGEISNRILKSYDGQGREIHQQEWNQAGSAITVTQYDLFGRVTCIINPLGQSIHTSYIMNEAAPRQEVTDPLGIKICTTYDPFGRTICEQRFDPMGQLVQQVDYGYDPNGNKILRRVKTENEPVDTIWEYDVLNQLKKATEAAGTPEQRNVQRRYDTAGRLITVIKNDGTSLNYTYDALGRRKSLKSSDGTLFYAYTYDQNDNLLTAEDKINGTAINRTYDAYDQLVSDILPYGHTLTYAYDLLGNVSEITLPDQTQICYVRQGDRLLSVDRKSPLTYSHAYTSYDAASNPTSICLGAEAGTLQIDYDLLNRPLNIHCPQWQETLAYDVHLLKQRTSQDALGKTISSYAYDARDQLLSEDGTASHTFEYDWQGNPTTYDGNVRKFDACNTLLDDSKHQYTYDANGNRISDGINTYSYDAMDRLVVAKTASGTYRYIYDALGRRVARLHDLETSYFLWQQQKEIGTISPSGVIEELQVLNPLNQAVAFELKGTLYIPLHDIFGHVRALLDSFGDCVATYRYSAFGEEQIDGSILSPWRYAGKRFDNETGFIYFGERYYDPATLCWLTPDPMEDADGPNLYAYVHNNPFFYVDPDGCFSFGWFENPIGRIALLAVEAALIASVVGWGVAGVAEGFMAGCSGGITGTAIDLACDAAAMYSEGGLAAACATAESSTISYNICKTIGRVAGAAFSCTPAGKATQVVVGGAKMGVNAVQATSTVVNVAKSSAQAKQVSNVANNIFKGSKISESTRSVDGIINSIKPQVAHKITGYTKHGINQAVGRNEGRGVSLNGILQAVKNPKKCISQANNTIKFVGEKATVILNSEGKIITTFGSSRGPQIWNWGKCK